MNISNLYRRPLPSSRSGPLYNAFPYPTKISPEAIALFIASHTKPGATVLDTFSGSGTTGLATLLCDKPTPTMKQMADQLGLFPKWGPRTAILYELGVLGSFISRVMCTSYDPSEFERAASDLLRQGQEKIGWFYKIQGIDGKISDLRYAIWSDVLICPCCKTEVSYWAAVVRRDPLRLDDSFQCSSCRKRVKVDNCERALESAEDDFLGKRIEYKKRVLVRVYGQTGRLKWQREPIEQDRISISKILQHKIPSCAPEFKIVWGDLQRTGYHKGITHLHHFYTRRNFIVLATLWELIDSFRPEIRDALRLLVLSYNATHSTIMTRVVVKNGQSDFILTGAQSGVLYVSGLPVEKNIFEGIKRKISFFKRSFEIVSGSTSQVNVFNNSSTKLALPDKSVDYVFTDPPFGDYIPYAEINQINEAWLGQTTDRGEEIIISDAQKKSIEDYGLMMRNVFKEIARVLKDKASATVVFHSAKAAVWQALADAYGEAGLNVQATSVLDKTQVSFKQVVSNVSVKGDPLLMLTKANNSRNDEQDISVSDVFNEIIERAIVTGDAQECQLQRLYSRFVSRCLELGIDVSIGAKDFYDRAKTVLEIA